MKKILHPPKVKQENVFRLQCSCDPDTITLNNSSNSKTVTLIVNSSNFKTSTTYDHNYLKVTKVDAHHYTITLIKQPEKNIELDVVFRIESLNSLDLCVTNCHVVIQANNQPLQSTTKRTDLPEVENEEDDEEDEGF